MTGTDRTESARARHQNKPAGDGPGLERLRASASAEDVRQTVVEQQSAAMATAGRERTATKAEAGQRPAEAEAASAETARRKPAKTTAPAPAAAASAATPEAEGPGAATEEKANMNVTAAARKSRFTGKTKTAARGAAKGARKAPGKKAAAAARGRVPRIKEDAHITRLFTENPRREGGKKHADYEILKKVTTVAGFLKAGGKRATLNSAVRRKHIKVG